MQSGTALASTPESRATQTGCSSGFQAFDLESCQSLYMAEGTVPVLYPAVCSLFVLFHSCFPARIAGVTKLFTLQIDSYKNRVESYLCHLYLTSKPGTPIRKCLQSVETSNFASCHLNAQMWMERHKVEASLTSSSCCAKEECGHGCSW